MPSAYRTTAVSRQPLLVSARPMLTCTGASLPLCVSEGWVVVSEGWVVVSVGWVVVSVGWVVVSVGWVVVAAIGRADRLRCCGSGRGAICLRPRRGGPGAAAQGLADLFGKRGELGLE